MAGSYFKGWVNTIPYIPTRVTNKDTRELYYGHVLEVFYDEKLPAKIRVRLVGVSQEYKDDDVKIEAYPADLSIVKVPLPGEVVIIIQSVYTESVDSDVQLAYYYFNTLATLQNITYNSDAYVGQILPEKVAEELFTGDYEKRFDNKIKSLSSYKNTINDELLTKKPFKPYEGDIIVQSRFGAGIRLGSSGNTNEDNPWSKNGGQEGNPIVIMTAHGEESTSETKLEDVNIDNSSVYVCTTQVIEIKMATSKNLQSHRHKYDAKLEDPENDYTKFIQTEFHAGYAVGFSGFDGPFAANKDQAPPATLGITSAAASLAYIAIGKFEGCDLYVSWDVSNWRTGVGSYGILFPKPGLPMIQGRVVSLGNDKRYWPYKQNPAFNVLTDKDDKAFLLADMKTSIDTYKWTNGGKLPGGIWNPNRTNNGKAVANVMIEGKDVSKFDNMQAAGILPVNTRPQADAEFAIRLINSMMPQLKRDANKKLDGSWPRMTIGIIAALASAMYNYGGAGYITNIMNKVTDPADPAQIIAAFMSEAANGNPTHSERRAKEAALVSQYPQPNDWP